MNNTAHFPEINEHETVPGFQMNERNSPTSYGV